MYVSDLKHIHDPVLSSLKMEGLRLLYLCITHGAHFARNVTPTRAATRI
jgi:hypothetical protein